jgi:hypothetical protein
MWNVWSREVVDTFDAVRPQSSFASFAIAALLFPPLPLSSRNPAYAAPARRAGDVRKSFAKKIPEERSSTNQIFFFKK